MLNSNTVFDMAFYVASMYTNVTETTKHLHKLLKNNDITFNLLVCEQKQKCQVKILTPCFVRTSLQFFINYTSCLYYTFLYKHCFTRNS